MAAKFTVGLIQVTATNEMAPNIRFIEEQTRLARDAGAQFVMTPENSTLIGANRADTLAKAQPEKSHESLQAMQALARQCGIWFLLGSIHVKVEPERNANRSYLIAPTGEIVASYDKIHMFDVQLASGETYRESSTFRPGDKTVIAQTPWGKLGMTICYDLRFPYLYRDLAHAGAEMLSIPSSFTVPTGRAHWHVLMRARAIETSCFVFAPAQVGTHAANRKTYGHSLVVAPWGEVLADAGDAQPGFVTAEIDMAKVAEARAAVPSLTHDRRYEPPVTVGTATAKAAE
ncbi:carbon-nitrogen hydrolase family protein [Vineibacter terrae]|uniref:Carbon-nitrogen hydrolase family protein n=1 Tax=Vineibacter terrae TaxID=2586908 RepID=A0A5C8PJ01_9HYPH|nr:carbon-nitrogen hydrolase family protein [Vineibacter terrae]TXL73792.1 carbon-nitrogen hydrolase family protein [Vineibacter terrae]